MESEFEEEAAAFFRRQLELGKGKPGLKSGASDMKGFRFYDSLDAL